MHASDLDLDGGRPIMDSAQLSTEFVHLEDIVLAEDREKKIHELFHPEDKPGFLSRLVGNDLSSST